MKHPLTFLLACLLAGCLPAAPKVDELYKQHCAACHGENLEGGLGPSLTDAKWKDPAAQRVSTHLIREGIPNSEMPGFGHVLEEREIEALTVFMREKAARKNPEKAAPVDGSVHKSQHHAFTVERWAKVDSPWAMAFLPDGTALVCEKKSGKLKHLSADGKVITTIKGTPEVHAEGQGGLLDVAIDPAYSQEPWIYLSYSHKQSGKAFTRIVRGQMRDGRWNQQQVLFEAAADNYRKGRVHYGSRFAFDKEGRLYFSIGDRGKQEEAQDKDKANGKIHRIHRDGSIPKDNPFRNERDALPSLYSFGHRNPQGLDIHPLTGHIWSTEHGPRGGDELNYVRMGENYGWPLVCLGINYNGKPQGVAHIDGMLDPKHHWTPSIAVSGLNFYTGSAFPKWSNDFFVSSLKAKELWRFRSQDDQLVERELVLKDKGRIREAVTGPDGYLYLVIDGPNILRLVPAE